MKVKLERGYKEIYTIADVNRAKAIIKFEKDDEMPINDWAEYAVNEALKGTNDCFVSVLKAEAHTAKNSRAWDLYGEDTHDMDVWIKAIAETREGFIKIGAYLSDIWQSGAIEYKDKMYIGYYTYHLL